MNNLAIVYQAIGQPQRALELLEQALPIRREVGDQAGEAATLNNLAAVYWSTGQPQRALELLEQALPITREVGDRAGEAATLNGMAYLFTELDRHEEARAAFEDSIALAQQITYPSAEAAGLVGLAVLFYQHLNLLNEAIARLEQAIIVLTNTGLDRDAAGQTLDQIQSALATMRAGGSI